MTPTPDPRLSFSSISALPTGTASLIIVNPNSSKHMTDALAAALAPIIPQNVQATFLTGPPSSPPAIIDPACAIASAEATLPELCLPLLHKNVPALAGPPAFLVACFSAHPLVPMLRETYPAVTSLHILATSVTHALAVGTRFGIITSVQSAVDDIDAGVAEVLLGSNASAAPAAASAGRYVGTIATGISPDKFSTMDANGLSRVLGSASSELDSRGADVIILGCAGMCGMESIVREGVSEGRRARGLPQRAAPVAVIDGAIAGVQLLSGLIASRYRG